MKERLQKCQQTERQRITFGKVQLSPSHTLPQWVTAPGPACPICASHAAGIQKHCCDGSDREALPFL